MSASALSAALLRGEPRALARGISLVEEQAPGAIDLLRSIFGNTGGASVLGITGPPGAGKSSLADRLISHYRARGARVGVLAVDPSSAFSGGAILGDRIRMQSHAADDGVFIRSMATRGHLGGLARASNDAIDLIDAAGFDPVIVETVGVGQDEIEVIKTADVVAVVLVPGMGDDIQAIKAGILEIADLFVINKADREGAARLETELAYMLALSAAPASGRPHILRTVAVRDEGVEALVEAFAGCLTARGGEGLRARRRERAAARLESQLRERLMARVVDKVLPRERFEDWVEKIAARTVDPYSAVDCILQELEQT